MSNQYTVMGFEHTAFKLRVSSLALYVWNCTMLVLLILFGFVINTTAYHLG